jgi:plasmid stabilization system protein ParE
LINKKLEITPEAEKDIFTIAANIQMQLNHQAAIQTISKFKNQLNALAEISDFGRAGVCEETREVVMRGLPYIAVYENLVDSVTIVRVLHGAEDSRSGKIA